MNSEVVLKGCYANKHPEISINVAIIIKVKIPE